MTKNYFETHSFQQQPLPCIFRYFFLDPPMINTSKLNWHTNLEIIYFTEGDGYMVCDSVEYPVKEGDIFVVNSNLSHAVYSENHVFWQYLILDNDFCHTIQIDPENTVFTGLISDVNAATLFRNVASAYKADVPYKNTAILSAIIQLLLYIAQNYTQTTFSPKKLTPGKYERIRPALNYMRANSHEKLALDHLAQIAGMNKCYFLRCFKEVTGHTPITYINKIRCDNAKKMLLSGKYSIREISEMCGFANFQYFSKVFKASEGSTPSEYIKTHTD